MFCNRMNLNNSYHIESEHVQTCLRIVWIVTIHIILNLNKFRHVWKSFKEFREFEEFRQLSALNISLGAFYWAILDSILLSLVWPVLEFANTQNLPLISVYVETARQVPGATIQIQTSAVQTTSRTWSIKTISLECETNFKYELESSTLKWKKKCWTN